MKSLLALLFASILTIGLVRAENPAPLEIGAELPSQDQVVKDVSGAELLLGDLALENGLLVIFTCNSCPYVLAWQDRYPGIAEFCDANDIGLVMLNPNEARRSSSDSYDAMQSHAKENDYDFYYAYDGNHVIADAMGATKTPDVFLYNENLKLAYKGAIDDNHRSAKNVAEPFLNNAMSNLINELEIDPNATKAIGGSIKRVQ